MEAADRDALGARLREYKAVMFGLDAGCPHTADMKRAWGPSLGRDMLYIACDAGAQNATLCERAGVSTTPTLVFGGVQFPGFVPLRRVEELVDRADAVGRQLAARRATVFVRPDCVWSARQRAVLGPSAALLDFVDCSTAERRCAEAGVRAVPAWRLGDQRAPLVHGFQPIPALQELLGLDEGELRRVAEGSAEGLPPPKPASGGR
jgi:glutaredoxin